jgi:hypothetical protein
MRSVRRACLWNPEIPTPGANLAPALGISTSGVIEMEILAALSRNLFATVAVGRDSLPQGEPQPPPYLDVQPHAELVFTTVEPDYVLSKDANHLSRVGKCRTYRFAATADQIGDMIETLDAIREELEGVLDALGAATPASASAVPEHVNRGTTNVLRIPVSAPPRSRPDPDPTAPVDDDASIAQAIDSDVKAMVEVFTLPPSDD